MHTSMRLLSSYRLVRVFMIVMGFSLLSPHLFAKNKARTPQKSDWTVYIYLQANNNLRDFAAENLAEIAAIGSSSKANILIQLDNPEANTHWRYRVEKGKITFDRVATNTPGDPRKSIKEFAEWGHENYPSDKHFLLLWNHGLGIIDPSSAWGWNSGSSLRSYQGFIERASLRNKKNYRGILFNEETRTYLNNQDMRGMLKDVTTIFGKKLDILGMDACFMAGVESIYQSREYTDIYIGSADIEPALGWQYAPFISQITQQQTSPLEVGHTIIKSFANLYKPYEGLLIYTQSGVFTERVETIRESVDAMTACFFKCIRKSKNDFKNLVRKARSQCLQFHNAAFIDLYSFCATLNGYIDEIKAAHRAQNSNDAQATSNVLVHFGSLGELAELDELQQALLATQESVNQSVFSHVSCSKLARGKGLSIYYPHDKRIDASYPKTEFAKNSLWLPFLYEMASN